MKLGSGAFELDGEHFHVGGLNLTATLKHKNVKQGSAKVTLERNTNGIPAH
jgi:hypothetical protein